MELCVVIFVSLPGSEYAQVRLQRVVVGRLFFACENPVALFNQSMVNHVHRSINIHC